jgi:ankyrin repeat protein
VLVTDKPIAVNDLIRPVLPQSMLQHCLVARAHVPAGVRAEAASPEKIQRRMPAEPPVFEQALSKHAQRREQGRDSDSESDADEPEKKATGMWFHRAVDFYETDGGSTVARVNEVIFDAVEAEDTKAILELANSGRLNIDAVKRDGMNPLMFAVSRGRVESAKALIEAGADVHVRREADNCPLLFMCIEAEELVHALIDAGANVDERFEGYRLEAHPSTMPNIAALIREVKNLPPVKTSALELAAAITV